MRSLARVLPKVACSDVTKSAISKKSWDLEKNVKLMYEKVHVNQPTLTLLCYREYAGGSLNSPSVKRE